MPGTHQGQVAHSWASRLRGSRPGACAPSLPAVAGSPCTVPLRIKCQSVHGEWPPFLRAADFVLDLASPLAQFVHARRVLFYPNLKDLGQGECATLVTRFAQQTEDYVRLRGGPVDFRREGESQLGVGCAVVVPKAASHRAPPRSSRDARRDNGKQYSRRPSAIW